jgi:hypothetical protein
MPAWKNRSIQRAGLRISLQLINSKGIENAKKNAISGGCGQTVDLWCGDFGPPKFLPMFGYFLCEYRIW